MKIAIDARMINMSGIGTYIKNLVKNDCYDIALGKKTDIEKVSNNIKNIEFDSPIYGIKEQLKFPYKEIKNAKIDAYMEAYEFSYKIVIEFNDGEKKIERRVLK